MQESLNSVLETVKALALPALSLAAAVCLFLHQERRIRTEKRTRQISRMIGGEQKPDSEDEMFQPLD